ncbi:hypothetical protein N9595_03990 [Bacteroidia bacterium]|nr:hypothetical protein [Bacteroidia bacterium]
MQKNKDYRLVGFLIGILAPLTILFGVQIYHFSHMSFLLFLKTGFVTGTLSPWLKIATLFNLAPFFLFINTNKLRTAQGVIFATIICGMFIVYFTLM